MTDRPSPAAALFSFLTALIGLEVFSALSALLAARGVRLGGFAYAYSIGFQGLVFALPTLFYYLRRPALRPALRRHLPDPLCALLLAAAALAGMVALNWISLYWMHFLKSFGLIARSGNEAVPRTAAQLWWMLAASAVAPAVFEELLFRGFLLPSLEPLGTSRAALLSGAMFALLHGRIEALPAHLLLGLLLAFLVLETDSLPAAMLYHAVHNAAVTVAAYGAYAADPSSLDAFPALSESPQALPAAVFWVGVWIFLVTLALLRGSKTKKRPLPPAPRRPLPGLARALLAGCALLLALVELRALVHMLPGSAP